MYVRARCQESFKVTVHTDYTLRVMAQSHDIVAGSRYVLHVPTRLKRACAHVPTRLTQRVLVTQGDEK